MNQRRIVINVKPAGWLGWLLLAVLAVPLLVLSFFFLTVALVLAAVLVAFAVARFYWLRHRLRSSGRTANRSQGRNLRTDIIDVEPVDVSDASNADNATPLNTLPPRSP